MTASNSLLPIFWLILLHLLANGVLSDISPHFIADSAIDIAKVADQIINNPAWSQAIPRILYNLSENAKKEIVDLLTKAGIGVINHFLDGFKEKIKEDTISFLASLFSEMDKYTGIDKF